MAKFTELKLYNNDDADNILSVFCAALRFLFRSAAGKGFVRSLGFARSIQLSSAERKALGLVALDERKYQ